MGAYRDCKEVEADLLDLSGIVPFGAFVKDGTIIPGWTAVNTFSTPRPSLVAMQWLPVGNRVIAGTSDGKVLIGNPGEGQTLAVAYNDGDSFPFVFDTSESGLKVVLVSGKYYTSVAGDTVKHDYFLGGLTCGTMRCGRLFGASNSNGYTLKWSGLYGFTDWSDISESGSLTLDPYGGRILNLVNFDDELVIFREGCIVRFAVAGDPYIFRVKDTIPVPPVTKNAQAITDDSILFFTASGLMRYRGGKVSRVEGAVTDDLNSVEATFVCLGRYVFFAGSSKSLGRKVVYVYDYLLDCYQLLDIPAYFISQDEKGVIAYTQTEIYRVKLRDEDALYSVRTPEIDFGSSKRKLLKELEVDCDDGVSVYVSNGVHTRKLPNPKGKNRLNMRGAKFRFIFEGGTASVRAARVKAEVAK